MKKVLEFKGEHRFLSNFYVGQPIVVGPWTFKTGEHFYQALKTEKFSEVKEIADSQQPYQAKKLGRKVTLRDNWEEVKDRAMEIVVARKFFSDPLAMNRLMDLDGLDLVEGNTWHDNYWGSCTCLDCGPKPKMNMLGKTLMNFRDEAVRWTDFDI